MKGTTLKHPSILLRLATVVGAALSLALVASTPAFAGADEAAPANLSNALDIAEAAASAPDPDVTCSTTPAGQVLVQHTVTPRASLDAQTVIAGEGQCVSLNRARSYNINVTVIEEAFINNRWIAVCSFAAPNSSSNGVAAAQGERLCNFPSGSAALNRYHRVHSILTTSVGTTPRNAYTGTFFLAA